MSESFLLLLTEQERQKLAQLQSRVDGINLNIEHTNKSLSLLDVNASQCINQINKRCAEMISKINTHRDSLLAKVSDHKQSIEDIHKTNLESLQCLKLAAEHTYKVCVQSCTKCVTLSIPYRLMAMNRIIDENKIREQALNIDKRQFNGIPSKISINTHELLDMHKFAFVSKAADPDHECAYDMENELMIDTKLQMNIKHQIVFEHWFRKLLDKPLIMDISNVIHWFVTHRESFITLNHCQTISIVSGGQIVRKAFKDGKECVFGSVVAMPGRSYHWKFRLHEVEWMCIGIIETDMAVLHTNKFGFDKIQSFVLTEPFGYGYCTPGEKYNTFDDGNVMYGMATDNGDEVNMYLDLKEKNTLSFDNGKFDFGVAWNVRSGVKYRLAIAIGGLWQESIELLDFVETDEKVMVSNLFNQRHTASDTIHSNWWQSWH
eukprot:24411_1